jgi:DNA-binding phage protein
MSAAHEQKRPSQPLETGDSKMKNTTHDAVMAEVFRQDPAYAVALLNSVLEEGKLDELVTALNQLAKAFGGVAEVDESSQTQLNRTLPESGKPEISSLAAMLKAIGLRLTVEQIQQPVHHE